MTLWPRSTFAVLLFVAGVERRECLVLRSDTDMRGWDATLGNSRIPPIVGIVLGKSKDPTDCTLPDVTEMPFSGLGKRIT